MIQYLDLHKETFPDVAQMPECHAGQAFSLRTLSSLIEHNQAVFECPSDHEFFTREGISYEYPNVRLAGRTTREVTERRKLSEVVVPVRFEEFPWTCRYSWLTKSTLCRRTRHSALELLEESNDR